MTEASLKLGALELLADPFEAQVGSSFGAWSAVTSQTSSLFLDGAVVSGEASANREIVLQVQVEATTRSALVAACEQLLVEANKQTNTLVFAPTAGPAVVYDVFRVQSPERFDDESEAWLRRTYHLTFPALPFARSSARATPSAVAPPLILSNFEDPFAGLALSSYVHGSTYDWVLPGKGSSAALDVDGTLAAGMQPVSNCAVADASPTWTNASGGAAVGSAHGFTATAAGTMDVRSAGSFPTAAGKVVSVGALFARDAAVGQMVGIEWLNSSGTTVSVDFGVPLQFSGVGTTYAAWCTATAPTGTAAYRLRIRFTGATAGKVCYTDRGGYSAAQGAVGDADKQNTASYHYEGTKGMYAAAATPSTNRSGTANQFATHIYGRIAAPVDVASKEQVGFWTYNLGPGTPTLGGAAYASLRLYDAAGRWSRWNMTGSLQAINTWARFYRPTADAPDSTSGLGAADLGDVVAYAIDLGGFGAAVDLIAAGPLPSATNSPRGSVFDLNPILGSARSPAQVGIAGSVALTDWLVAAVKPNRGEPMLAVTTNKATAAAPAKYDGVYSIIGCISPATAQTAPTCTVVQKINGTQVATQTLTGTVQAGNHYVDFGPVALPLVDVPDENAGVSIEFTLAPSSTAWTEVLVIDVDASLAWVPNQTTAMAQAWVDEPDTLAQLGRIFVGTLGDRTDARALPTPPVLSRPLQVQAPSTRLLVYSTAGAPNVSLSYYPRWLIEPTA